MAQTKSPGYRLFTPTIGRPYHAFAVLVEDHKEALLKIAYEKGIDGLHAEIVAAMERCGVPKQAIPNNSYTSRNIFVKLVPDIKGRLRTTLIKRRSMNFGRPSARQDAEARPKMPVGRPTKTVSPVPVHNPSLDAYVENIAADVATIKDDLTSLKAAMATITSQLT